MADALVKTVYNKVGTRVDVAFDRYLEEFIKREMGIRRTSGNVSIRRIVEHKEVLCQSTGNSSFSLQENKANISDFYQMS